MCFLEMLSNLRAPEVSPRGVFELNNAIFCAGVPGWPGCTEAWLAIASHCAIHDNHEVCRSEPAWHRV